jgi:hypothetical protein
MKIREIVGDISASSRLSQSFDTGRDKRWMMVVSINALFIADKIHRKFARRIHRAVSTVESPVAQKMPANPSGRTWPREF